MFGGSPNRPSRRPPARKGYNLVDAEKILQLKLFSCLDHVVRQSSVCSEQSEMSGEGQGSAKIRRGWGQVEEGGAIEEGLFGQRDWQKGAGTGKLEIPPTLSYPASPSLLWATPPPLQRLRT